MFCRVWKRPGSIASHRTLYSGPPFHLQGLRRTVPGTDSSCLLLFPSVLMSLLDIPRRQLGLLRFLSNTRLPDRAPPERGLGEPRSELLLHPPTEAWCRGCGGAAPPAQPEVLCPSGSPPSRLISLSLSPAPSLW